MQVDYTKDSEGNLSSLTRSDFHNY